MLASAIHQFECTNCGGTDPVTLIVALVALAVAIASAIVAWPAFKREHVDRPKVDFEPTGAGPDGVVRLDPRPGGRGLARVNLGFRNVGKRPAENVSVNVLFPSDVTFYLASDSGQYLGVFPATATPEPLVAPEGHEVAAHWRHRPIGHVSVETYTSVRVVIDVELPPTGEERQIAMRPRVIGDGLDGGKTDFDYVIRVGL